MTASVRPVPTPAEAFAGRTHVCRLRVSGGLVYDSPRMTEESAIDLVDELQASMEASHRIPVVQVQVPGYARLSIATRSITTVEAVPADTPVGAPLANNRGHR